MAACRAGGRICAAQNRCPAPNPKTPARKPARCARRRISEFPALWCFFTRYSPIRRCSFQLQTISSSSHSSRIRIHHFLHVIEIGFRLQRIVNAVVSGVEQVRCRSFLLGRSENAKARWLPPIRAPSSAPVETMALTIPLSIRSQNIKPHFANRQRAGQRHHHETIFVARHGFQHVGGITHSGARCTRCRP